MTNTNQNATPGTQTPDDARFEAEHARRAFTHLGGRALDDLRQLIATVRHRLDDAERRLDAGELPSRCGIIQSAAYELEMAVARAAALSEATPLVKVLANAAGVDAAATVR